MIKIIFDKDKNCAMAFDEEKNIGICNFNVSSNTWNITHTYVDNEYQGQGIAKQLVMKVVNNANMYKTQAKQYNLSEGK